MWWLSVPLWLVELHGALTLALFALVTWDTDATPRPAPVQQPPGRVAVLIPTYNEPLEVLLPTVAAAVAMHQPHETWVLDDGDRGWVRELAAELGARYSARPTHEHAKAGNINTALRHVDADFVAVLDADHVASPEFLENTLGYFADEDVALVQTPQDFYNPDSFEHVAQRRGTWCEQSLFYRVMQPGRNRWNAAFWCGTGAVIRTSALAEVGGLATDSITEDIHTTIRLHRAGWRTAYHDEVLARGLAAADGAQYLSQRVRWGTGAMQVLRQENPVLGRGLTLPQRLSYAGTLLGWFDAWRTLLCVLLPIATLLTGATPLDAPVGALVLALLPTLLLQHLATVRLSRGHASVLSALLFEFVRLPANLAATLTLFSGRDPGFTVTDKGRTGDDRRRTAVPRLHLLLGALGVSALGWYALTLAGATPLHYGSAAAAHVCAVLLILQLGVLVAAVRRIRSERFSTERRASVRLEVAGAATVDGQAAQLVDVSCTGARVVLPLDAPVRPLLDLRVTVGGTQVALASELVAARQNRGGGSGTRTCTLRFLPGQLAAQAALAYAVFALAAGTPTRVRTEVPAGAVPAQRPAPRSTPVPAAQPLAPRR